MNTLCNILNGRLVSAMVVTTSLVISSCGNAPKISKAQKSGTPGGGGLSGAAIPDVINFMTAKFNTTAKVKLLLFDMDACKGSVGFQVNVAANQGATNQLFKIPEGKLKCSGLAGNMGDNGEIDLAKMMGGFAAAPPSGINPIEIQDNVISMTSLGNSVYAPARPFLPAFISATPDQLRNLNVSRSLTVNDTAKGTTSNGTANLQVLGYGASYRPPHLNIGHEFQNVLIYELRHQGFDNIQVMNNMLWDRFKMWISLEPFAILRIEMVATVGDALASSSNPQAGEQQITQMAGTLGSLLGGPALGPILGQLGTQLIKSAEIRVEMDIIEMDNLQQLINQISTGGSRPTSGGQVIK